jgi:hypothetical protein
VWQRILQIVLGKSRTEAYKRLRGERFVPNYVENTT